MMHSLIRVKNIVEELGLKVFCGESGLENIVRGSYVCDLLSDVMGHSNEGQIWITLQTHKNIMAVASLRDLAAIILVKDLVPEPETIVQSNLEGIPVLGTSSETFEMAGKLYKLLQHDESIQS
jgi:hypothetical protein